MRIGRVTGENFLFSCGVKGRFERALAFLLIVPLHAHVFLRAPWQVLASSRYRIGDRPELRRTRVQRGIGDLAKPLHRKL